MEKHLFLGSNTPDGFVGHFEDLFNISKVIILKGGSGTGKSTLMKKIGKEAQLKGLDTEYYHCSSDVTSLDGLYLPTLKWSILDGTSPHALEPKMPAINQFLFNLADKADFDLLQKSSNEIYKKLKYKKQCFNNAFRYLKSAYYLLNKINNTQIINTNITFLNNLALDIYKLCEGHECKHSRLIFSEAITPQGIVSYAESCFKHTNNIILQTENPALAQYVISKIQQFINAKKLKHIEYLSPFNPKIANALQIGSTVISFDKNAINNHLQFELDKAIKTDFTSQVADDLNLYNQLINKAFTFLQKARDTHKEMENYYIAAMDFNDINYKTEQISDLIFKNFD